MDNERQKKMKIENLWWWMRVKTYALCRIVKTILNLNLGLTFLSICIGCLWWSLVNLYDLMCEFVDECVRAYMLSENNMWFCQWFVYFVHVNKTIALKREQEIRPM